MEDDIIWLSENTITTTEISGSKVSLPPHYGKDPENLGPVPEPDLTFQVYTKTVDDKEYTRKEISRISDTKTKAKAKAVMSPTLIGFLIFFIPWFLSISGLIIYFYSIPMIPLTVSCEPKVCLRHNVDMYWDDQQGWLCYRCQEEDQKQEDDPIPFLFRDDGGY